MSHEERNVVTEILANAVIIGLFLWFLVAGQAAGRFDGPDGVQVWAVLVLKLIGVSIVIGHRAGNGHGHLLAGGHGREAGPDPGRARPRHFRHRLEGVDDRSRPWALSAGSSRWRWGHQCDLGLNLMLAGCALATRRESGQVSRLSPGSVI
jgi:hypothetical protein